MVDDARVIEAGQKYFRYRHFYSKVLLWLALYK